ncbi:MAG: hypothetical protein J0M12_16440, partial [Deltaproteobacteria bacterium]|nr:hypothetical protein [Deltaproteobacteria bacterium]
MNAHQSKYSKEHGVVIPLLAVISLGILTVLIVLGVNASIVKYASVDLRTEVNEICSDLADRHIGAQINIAREFATRVNSFAENLPSRIELVSATLIAPTMPEDFAFPSGFASGAQGADHLVNPPFLADSAQSLCSGPNFFSSDASVCGGTSFCSGSTKCMFQGDVLSSIPENPAPAGGAQMSDKYPETMLNNLTNAGNTVLCEFRAKVKNLWLGTADQDIAVRVGFWQPAVGYPDYVPGDPPPFGFTTSPASIPFPGFSIAVA